MWPSRAGMDRNSFYDWKRRFQAQGFEGLKDLPLIHKSHPQTTPPEIVEKIKARSACRGYPSAARNPFRSAPC